MKTTYLGTELRSPVIVGSSPYTSTPWGVERCADAGAGAVVLKSIFEEQILHETAALERESQSPYGDAAAYLERYLGDDYRSRFLTLVADAVRRVDIPVIASINCIGDDDRWIDYAAAMTAAGAYAVELNIFLQPAEIRTSAAELEQRYVNIARKVAERIEAPVSVKLPMRFTNLYRVADALLGAGVRGAVLFNRYFEPDVDIDRIAFVEGSPYSHPSELRNALRTAAVASALLPQLDFALSTGIHDGEAAVKALLCGARAVQLCTALHHEGYGVIGRIGRAIDLWAERHGFASIDEFRGRLDRRRCDTPLFERVQYMKYFPEEP